MVNAEEKIDRIIELKRWEEWFKTVNMEKEWKVLIELFENDYPKLIRWAQILEFNRLNAALSK